MQKGEWIKLCFSLKKNKKRDLKYVSPRNVHLVAIKPIFPGASSARPLLFLTSYCEVTDGFEACLVLCTLMTVKPAEGNVNYSFPYREIINPKTKPNKTQNNLKETHFRWSVLLNKKMKPLFREDQKFLIQC